MFKIYSSEYNPQNLTGQVGGDISSLELSGYLGELFYYISSPPSGINTTSYQYRKVFFKNEYTKISTNTRIWIDAAEHQEQLSICLSSGLTDYSATPTGAPVGVTGWSHPSNYANGLELGTLPVNQYTGIWIRQALSGISNPDPYASFRLYIGGLVI